MDRQEVLHILSDKKVLCADDDEGILANIVEILDVFFHKAVGVSDGKQALEELECHTYDVLMFDICMPNIDGLEAIREIRKKDSKIPIVILSAHTDQPYLWRAVDLKITKFLTKPLDKKTLYSALEKISLELVDNHPMQRLGKSYRYDYCKKIVHKEGKIIQLSKTESRLLELFIRNRNHVLSYEEILDCMWDFDQPSQDAIKYLIKELRRKIDSSIIKNVYGLGYMYEV